MKITLVCPNCRALLKATPRKYICKKCGSIYPVQKKIPLLFDKLGMQTYRRSFKIPQAYYRRAAKSFGKAHHVDMPGGRLFVKDLEQKLKPFVKSDRKILEVGAGTGFATEALNELNKFAVVSDSSLEMLLFNKAAKRKIKVCCSAENLPFKENSFDLVFGNNMLYLVPDKKRAARSLAKVLKTGGKIIFSEMNPYLFLWLVICVMTGRLFELRIYSIFPWQVRSKFKTAGFKLRTVEFYSFTPYFANKGLIKFCLILEKIVGRNLFLRRLFAIRVLYVLEKT